MVLVPRARRVAARTTRRIAAAVPAGSAVPAERTAHAGRMRAAAGRGGSGPASDGAGLSPAAREQLQRGWQLTGRRDESACAVLERYFGDAGLYARAAHEFHYGASAHKPLVTPATPVRAGPLRGTHMLFAQLLFTAGLLRRCRARCVLPGQLGTLYYFPPWHPVAQARFSRPAFVALRGRGEVCNGAAPRFTPRNGRSMNPLDYAVFRGLARKRFARALQAAWTREPRVPLVDGVYVVQINRVPRPGQADAGVRAALEQFARSGHAWAADQLGPADRAAMDAQLRRLKQPPVQWLLRSEDWQ